MSTLTNHQKKQIEVINKIEGQINRGDLRSSTITQVIDYENDSRLCLTCVHLIDKSLKEQINKAIIQPLKNAVSLDYYYPSDSLHLTLKNIRVINNPPNFNKESVLKAKEVMSLSVPGFKKFSVFFYRLLLFPTSLALIGTTDQELDNIHISLDKKLKEANVPDDKKYVNNQYFFANITLARFNPVARGRLAKFVNQISNEISIPAYTVDSITLLTSNAVLKKKNVIDTWLLK